MSKKHTLMWVCGWCQQTGKGFSTFDEVERALERHQAKDCPGKSTIKWVFP